ncbi:MAG: hypothetical protein KAR32_03170 [Candidatus Omnitrophica bacterium]|nr:hypothetical protein [Candidatus Omnitrophota bacterium]
MEGRDVKKFILYTLGRPKKIVAVIATLVVPMLVAVATVLITMGLLSGLGFPVHIMSSMIPIFLMPIAVLDDEYL